MICSTPLRIINWMFVRIFAPAETVEDPNISDRDPQTTAIVHSAPDGNNSSEVEAESQFQSQDTSSDLHRCGLQLFQQFQRSGGISILEESISFERKALALSRPGHPDISKAVITLSNALRTKFEHTGRAEDLEEAIQLLRDAFPLIPSKHPDYSEVLNNLAIAVLIRFEQGGKSKDLEEAIKLLRDALSLRLPGNPDRSASLTNLAGAIWTKFKQMGKVADLEETILLYRDALELLSRDHPDRTSSLNGLAVAVRTRFQLTGKMDDLKEGIQLHRDALALRPVGHPNRTTALNNLANALCTSYQRTGEIDDLEEGISLFRDTLSLRPLGHPNRYSSLNNLAGAVWLRFHRNGLMTDLDEAVKFYRDGLELCTSGHPNRSSSLSNLAVVVCTRFAHIGKMADLEEGIRLYKDALALQPLGHPGRSMSLCNLANGLCTRFQQNGKKIDLDDAIRLHREALVLRPLGHVDRSVSLSSLANIIASRFEETNNEVDLEEVIQLHRDALALRQFGHPDRFVSLLNLANAIQIRSEKTGRMDDFEEASKFLLDAEGSCSFDHPLLGLTWRLLARIHLRQYVIDQSDQHIFAAFTLLRKATVYKTASINNRLRAALHWVAEARMFLHESLLEAYSMALDLANRYIIASPSIEHQYRLLVHSIEIPQSLGLDAAATAINAGQTKIAVEFLEQGRTFLWSDVRRFRHPIEVLRGINPDLASEFETLGHKLELLALSLEDAPVVIDESVPSRSNAETTRNTSPELGNEPKTVRRWYAVPQETRSLFSKTPGIYDAKQREHRRLSEQWDSLILKIRSIDGFSDFLKAVPFSTLQSASIEGPVIVVNVSRFRSDAIIIFESLEPILVPLPDARLDVLSVLSTRFSDSLASKAEHRSEEFCENLGVLWKIVVCPIADKLNEIGVAEGSRIWWCPTSYLCSLPLHAAGPFLSDDKGRRAANQWWLPDRYVSSYTSTLSVLIAARANAALTGTIPSLLVVAQPQSLAHVEEEVLRIKKFGKIVKTMIGSEATRDAILQALPDYPFVHFACHSSVHPEPLHSSFRLWEDDKLELLDLIKARVPNAELAFLSSCHGAAADVRGNPDEVIHLAAALQFCGYRSVVGTLWVMMDADGPAIAEDFYRYLFHHDAEAGQVDVKNSGRALSTAIQEMKKRKGLIGDWINFVHIGI